MINIHYYPFHGIYELRKYFFYKITGKARYTVLFVTNQPKFRYNF